MTSNQTTWIETNSNGENGEMNNNESLSSNTETPVEKATVVDTYLRTLSEEQLSQEMELLTETAALYSFVERLVMMSRAKADIGNKAKALPMLRAVKAAALVEVNKRWVEMERRLAPASEDAAGDDVNG